MRTGGRRRIKVDRESDANGAWINSSDAKEQQRRFDEGVTERVKQDQRWQKESPQRLQCVLKKTEKLFSVLKCDESMEEWMLESRGCESEKTSLTLLPQEIRQIFNSVIQGKRLNRAFAIETMLQALRIMPPRFQTVKTATSTEATCVPQQKPCLADHEYRKLIDLLGIGPAVLIYHRVSKVHDPILQTKEHRRPSCSDEELETDNMESLLTQDSLNSCSQDIASPRATTSNPKRRQQLASETAELIYQVIGVQKAQLPITAYSELLCDPLLVSKLLQLPLELSPSSTLRALEKVLKGLIISVACWQSALPNGSQLRADLLHCENEFDSFVSIQFELLQKLLLRLSLRTAAESCQGRANAGELFEVSYLSNYLIIFAIEVTKLRALREVGFAQLKAADKMRPCLKMPCMMRKLTRVFEDFIVTHKDCSLKQTVSVQFSDYEFLLADLPELLAPEALTSVSSIMQLLEIFRGVSNVFQLVKSFRVLKEVRIQLYALNARTPEVQITSEDLEKASVCPLKRGSDTFEELKVKAKELRHKTPVKKAELTHRNNYARNKMAVNVDEPISGSQKLSRVLILQWDFVRGSMDRNELPSRSGRNRTQVIQSICFINIRSKYGKPEEVDDILYVFKLHTGSSRTEGFAQRTVAGHEVMLGRGVQTEAGKKTGRQADVSLLIDNSKLSVTVSRAHAALTLSNDKKAVFLKDLSSTNGLFVNDVKLQPETYVRLKEDDLIIFGGGHSVKPGEKIKQNTNFRYKVRINY